MNLLGIRDDKYLVIMTLAEWNDPDHHVSTIDWI